jgi:integrase
VDGKGGLAPRTVRYIHTVLRRAFEDAVRRRNLAINPVDLADAPSASAAKAPEMKVWSIEELRAFLEHVRSDRLQGAYVLAGLTGMRRGEILGLRWSDVNLDQALLDIRQTLIVIDYKIRLSEPKTKRSRRTIPVDPATVAALKNWRSVQAHERLAWGPAWTDTGLVFGREDGTQINPQMLSDAFERQTKAAGLPPIRLHDLRHTYATIALDSDMKAWDLSDRLGHSSVAFTLDVYRHAIRSTQQESALRTASVILGTGA